MNTNTNNANANATAEAIAAAVKAALTGERAKKEAKAQQQKQYRGKKKAEQKEANSKEVARRCEDFGLVMPQGMDTDEHGNIRNTLSNCIHILESQPWGFGFDMLARKSVFRGDGVKWPAHYGTVLDEDLVRVIRFQIMEVWGVEFTTQQVFDSLKTLCRAEPFHPVVEYLDQLEWDGNARLDDWLTRYCRVPETEYSRAVGGLWLVAAVRRVRQPGCKFDNVLCLEGETGGGKSSTFKTLGGDWFSEGKLSDIGTRYEGMSLAGSWIVEIPEMKAGRGVNLEDFKAFVSRWEDRYHPPHEPTYVTRPRQCVFGSNSNRNDYLDDPTGYRRAWPVRCGEVNLEALAKDRDQLFAEAAVLEAMGKSIMLPRELWQVAAKEQAARYVPHPWEDDLREHLEREGDKVHASDLYIELGFERKERNRKLAAEVRGVMTRLGWEPCDSVKIGTKVSTGYKRVAAAKESAT